MISNSEVVDKGIESLEISGLNLLKASPAMFSVQLAEHVMSASPPAPLGVRTHGRTQRARTYPPVVLHVALNVNGRQLDVRVDSRTTLLNALRETLVVKGMNKVAIMGSAARARFYLAVVASTPA